MSPSDFKGVYPATLPSYRSDGKISGPALQQLIETQLRAGVNEFYVSGGTGEGSCRRSKIASNS